MRENSVPKKGGWVGMMEGVSKAHPSLKPTWGKLAVNMLMVMEPMPNLPTLHTTY